MLYGNFIVIQTTQTNFSQKESSFLDISQAHSQSKLIQFKNSFYKKFILSIKSKYEVRSIKIFPKTFEPFSEIISPNLKNKIKYFDLIFHCLYLLLKINFCAYTSYFHVHKKCELTLVFLYFFTFDTCK